MGQKIILVDDLDGKTENAVPVSFFVDGQEYEIDLGPANEEKYKKIFEDHRKMLLKLAESGRPVKRQTPLAAPRGRTKEQLDEIRRWARNQGFEVKNNGRIPDKVIDAYETRNRLAEIEAKREGGDNSDGSDGEPKVAVSV
jgi:hypothetical protein